MPDAKDAKGKELVAQQASNIKDELNEVIVLKDVRLLIGEYIPFGVNHIVAFNTKLGSFMRVKSALLTQVVDDDPGGMQFEIPAVLTEVLIKKFDKNDFVDFEATIHYPEPPGIVQEEHFGVHVDYTGKILYGLDLIEIAGRGKDHVSLDHLSRVLADIVQDSSQMMGTLLTDYQRKLLDLTYFGKSENRDKYTFVLAQGAVPLVPAKEYLDGEDRENELRQILETFQDVFDLADGSKLLVGTHGTILVSKDPTKYEYIATEYSFLMSMDIFIQNFFSRLFMMNDSVKDIRTLIDMSEEDPNAVDKAQSELSQTTGDAILLKELLEYLRESTIALGREWEICEKGLSDPSVKDAALKLGIKTRIKAARDQVLDMEHVIDGLLRSLEGLSAMNETINQHQMRHFQETLEENAKSMEEVAKNGERTSAGVEIMEIILSGTLVLDLVALFTGGLQFPNLGLEGGTDALVWALISVGFWAIAAVLLFLTMKWLGDRSEPALVVRLKLNRKYNPKNLKAFMEKREITTQDLDLYSNLARKRIMWKYNDGLFWEELPGWGKRKVIINMAYDENTKFLLNTVIEVQFPGEMKISEIREAFMAELKDEKVFS
jgi:WD repeat-containing protein 35